MRDFELKRKPTFAVVVAAAIRDEAGRLLLQQCPAGKPHAGLWEFPGGKVETGESPRLALCREVAEELGIELREADLEPAGFAEETAAAGCPAFVLMLYTSLRWQGEPQGLEGQAWGWFAPAEAAALPMPAMDRILLARLHPEAAA